MGEFLDLISSFMVTGFMRLTKLPNKICNLIFNQRWIYCKHEDKYIIPVGFADWKCAKCGVES